MKYWNYVVISVFMAFLFELAGVSIAGALLQRVGISTTESNLLNSLLYLSIFAGGGLLVGLIAGISVGVITRSSPENFIILPFVIGGGLFFMTTFASAITYAFTLNLWIGAIVSLILSPLLIGFIIASIEFFRGTD